MRQTSWTDVIKRSHSGANKGDKRNNKPSFGLLLAHDNLI